MIWNSSLRKKPPRSGSGNAALGRVGTRGSRPTTQGAKEQLAPRNGENRPGPTDRVPRLCARVCRNQTPGDTASKQNGVDIGYRIATITPSVAKSNLPWTEPPDKNPLAFNGRTRPPKKSQRVQPVNGDKILRALPFGRGPAPKSTNVPWSLRSAAAAEARCETGLVLLSLTTPQTHHPSNRKS